MEDWESLLNQLRAEFLLREEELGLLHEIDLQLLDSEPTLRKVFSLIVDRTRDLLEADHVHILIRRGRFLETTYSASGTDVGQRLPIATSITGLCFSENRTINAPDVTVPPLSERYVPLLGFEDAGIRSLLATPIRLHDTTIGVLNAESSRHSAFKPVHERISAAVSAQAAIALQRVQLFDEAALFADVDKLIFAVQDPDSEDVLQSALERVMDELRAQRIELSGAQILFPRGEHELQIVHSTNPSDVGLAVNIAGSICGRAVRERRTVVVGDVSKDPEYRRMLGPAIQSEIAVPILFGNDDIVIGVLNVESEELDVFSGFYELVLNRFADKVKMLLAFTKLRSDVTAALELRTANDLLVAVGDQTSNMIHRLNNTVGAMRFRIRELQALQDGGSLRVDAELRESLQALLALADRTLEMPQRVTKFLSQDRNIVDVNQCVETSISEVGVPETIEVEKRLSKGIPPLQLFSFDIVVMNLLRNAVDAMPKGGRLIISTSRVSHPELPTGYVQLSIADTGSGIPKEILPHVFDLNFTTKREKEGRGLGLGLWWVRNFIKRASGEIAMRSSPGNGTEVIVKIPFGNSSSP